MEQYNARLKELLEQMARQHKLKVIVSDLERQQSQLRDQVQALKEIVYKEQLDVDHLEGISAAKLFYQLIGRLDEKLEKEEAEVCAAALKYEAKRRELQAVEEDLSAHRGELHRLKGCETEYARLLAEKASAMKAMNSFYSQQICALEERIAYLGAQEKELREAVYAGKSALQDVDAIQDSLSSAEGWGTWDVFGGGIISDVAKHSALDDAQRQVTNLQRSLSRFRTELADVTIQSDLQIQIDGFLRFADYFFDGIFADWAVLDRIHSSQAQVSDVERSVRNILNQLDRQLTDCVRERDAKRRELDDLVLKA